MNRENKRKKYENGYYKNHPCNNTFTCKVCKRGDRRCGLPQDRKRFVTVQPGSGIVPECVSDVD